MSRTRPTTFEAVALLTVCPRCDRGPGLWCVATRRWSGEPYAPSEAPWAASLHQLRRAPVEALWRESYVEGVLNGLDEALAEMKRPGLWTRTLERVQRNRDTWGKWYDEIRFDRPAN